jgi:hypothetical protein
VDADLQDLDGRLNRAGTVIPGTRFKPLRSPLSPDLPLNRTAG